MWSEQPTENLHLRIAPGGASGYGVTLERDGGQVLATETVAAFDFARVEHELLGPLRSFALRAVPDALLETLGRELAARLLPPRLREALAAILASRPSSDARVRLWIELPELRGLPWEFSFVGTEDRVPALAGFLCLDSQVHLVRHSPPVGPVELIAAEPLRVLLVWADTRTPQHPALAHLRAEAASVLSALRAPECRVVVEELPYATPEGLKRALADHPPHILHFIGHAEQRPSGGVLILHGDGSRPAAPVYGEELAEWLPSDVLRLAVLSACATTAPAGGVAELLLRGGLPAVVAMQLPLRDATAGLFARAFYAALAEPLPVEQALRQARQALRGAGPDWGVPVLHLAAPTGALFRPQPAAPSTNLPYRRNPHFVGRVETLLQLCEALEQPDHQPVALVGMGGQGKTQLAIEYAHTRSPSYPGGIYWLGARDTHRLIEDYATLGRFFHVSEEHPTAERAALVRDRLRQLGTASLLILDNLAADTDLILPSGGSCRILITTRERYLVRDQCRVLELASLSEAEALRLLQTHRQAESPEELEAAREIVGLLGGLPLALALAASQVERLGTSFASYRSRLAGNRVEVLEHARRRFVTATGHSGSVWDTIDLSFRSLEAAAHHVLGTAACFAGRGISPDRLFEASGLDSREELDEALADLRDTSLVTRERDARLTLHELVRVYARGRMPPEERRETLASVSRTLAGCLHAANETMNWAEVRLEVTHAVTAAALCQEHGEDALLVTLAEEIGVYRAYHGDKEAALASLERGLAAADAAMGRESREAARLLRLIAVVSQSCLDTARALSSAREALTLAERVLAPDDPDLAEYYNAAGYVLKMQGDRAAALPLYRRSLEINTRVHGRVHSEVATCLNNIGTLLEAQGDMDGALQHLLEALEIDEATFGPAHPKAAVRHNNIGRILGRQERWEAALPHHEQAARIHEATYGRVHLDVGYSLFYCAEAEYHLGRHDPARACYLEALAILQQVCGPDHRLEREIQDRLRLLGEETGERLDNRG